MIAFWQQLYYFHTEIPFSFVFIYLVCCYSTSFTSCLFVELVPYPKDVSRSVVLYCSHYEWSLAWVQSVK